MLSEEFGWNMQLFYEPERCSHVCPKPSRPTTELNGEQSNSSIKDLLIAGLVE
jgi:hypothetical protein